MTTAPKVSVLLPTHNRPEVLEPAIRSALAQTLEDFELLVVGDGCTDGTAELVRGFDDPRIRWFDLPKAAGFGYANRNVALREARGALIAFLGHDNLLFPDHLQQLSRPFKDAETMFAYSRPLWIRDDGAILPVFVNLKVPKWRNHFLRVANILPATCVVHRRAALDEVGYWPETIERAGDWDLWKRIVSHYPDRALRVIRSPTCLHFRADWRTDARWAPPPVLQLSLIEQTAGYWPEALRLRLDLAGIPPQAQVWDRMSAAPDKFVRDIRGALPLLQDHLAWAASAPSSLGR